MIPIPRYLQNHEEVVQAFGYWPMFHDSPVCQFHVTDDSIELELEAWEMTPETDERGYFILAKKHRIGFRFSQLQSTDLSNFDPANILFELGFSSAEDYESQGWFSVELDSVMGSDLSGRFQARQGAVTLIQPLPSRPDPRQ